MVVKKLALLTTDCQGPLLVSSHVHGPSNVGVSAKNVNISKATLRLQEPAQPLPGSVQPLLLFTASSNQDIIVD